MYVFYTVTSHNQESESCLDKSGNFAKIKQAQCGMQNHMEHQNVHPTFVFYMVKHGDSYLFLPTTSYAVWRPFKDVNKKSPNNVFVLISLSSPEQALIFIVASQAPSICSFSFGTSAKWIHQKKKRSLANRYQQKMLLALEVLYLRLHINIGPVTTVSTPHLRFLVKTKAFCSQQNGSW